MNGSQNMMECDFQKPFPGCIASMISIFDLSASTARTKMLTEKPHTEGSAGVSRHSDFVKKPIDFDTNPIEETQVASNQRRSPPSKRSSGIPIKNHIAQEMRKETKHNQKSPTVVARLMGLDSLPMQQLVLTDKQSSKKSTSCDDSVQNVKSYRWEEDKHFNKQVRNSPGKKIHKDVYEVWQQPSRNHQIRDQSSQRGIYEDSTYQMRMALVQQKFIEAKRLATDENFLQSKEFRDAIEVLSSNRDLFVKFLEEPNSLFSKHLSGLHSAPLPSQTKCITVLKPLSAIEEKSQKGREEQLHQADQIVRKTKHYRSSSFPEMESQSLSQPTRIVVLKPSPASPCDVKKAVAYPIISHELLHGQGSCGALQTNKAIGSRELAKEITRRMRESLSTNRRDGDLLSSVLSSGYVGDESSFHRTESDYMEEEVGSLSNSEIATPTSQHSWDFLKRAGSPSLSSFSRASQSPESSVTREAKKRLSERLALVASSGNGQEQRLECRSSSTLGEMLAIPALKKEDELDASSSRLSSDKKKHPEVPLTPFSNDLMKDECSGNISPTKLSRSKSVPVSSSVFESTEFNVAVPSSLVGERVIQKEVPQSKSVKLSFKGKFSSLLFSRNKKQIREKPILYSPVNSDQRLQHGTTEAEACATAGDLTEHANDPDKTTASCTTSAHDGSDMVAVKSAPYFEKPRTCGNIIQNQDQPSPITVSEASFTDDVNNPFPKSSGNAFAGHPQALSRSPPIESVARSLSRSNHYMEITSPYPLRSSTVLSKADEEHAQPLFVKKLISSAGLCKDKSSLMFTKWYSVDLPLNPLLLDELVYMKDEEDDIRHKGTRSIKRLLFDCVNAALLELSLKTMSASYTWSGACSGAPEDGTALADEVWGIIRSWMSSENCMLVQCNNNPNVVADRLVTREITGRQWTVSMWLEMQEFSKEIGGKLLEDLVEEALSELIT